MYKVIKKFIDAETLKEYNVGDEYDVSNTSQERLEELMGNKNKIGIPLIKQEGIEIHYEEKEVENDG